ncbi:uncharacterized protein [Euphorbia lathyris]|uniref:uncharacterized protein isoform X2 n=1 Tax=Euphorbia lathyris TaxID=212925 RepID=UPI0033136DEA
MYSVPLDFSSASSILSSSLTFCRLRSSMPLKFPSFFNSSSRTGSPRLCRASLITTPDSFEVGRLIGSYGFMNITSYSGYQLGMDMDYSPLNVEKLKVQDVGEGGVTIRLYEGRIAQGLLKGTRVIFKVYPGQRAGGVEADMMAANELNAHIVLQSSPKDTCRNLLILVGGFETKTGEQWLAFRNDGKYSAADYAKIMSERISKSRSQGENSWNRFDQEETINRRRYFITRLLTGVISGLAYMHNHDRLHQSIGPSSVVLKISNLQEGVGTLSEGLWRRATAAGAFTTIEKRAFGIADDIYEAGLLFAYLAFVPFCEAGIMDALSLQRLLESTFQLDLEAAREYCLADDRLEEAVKFLDVGDGAGWQLLQAMLNPEFRKRPIAEAVLNHRFLTGLAL